MKGIRVCCEDYPKKEELLIQELHALYAISPNKKSVYPKVKKLKVKKRRR